jgi:hypothetical protein
LKTIRTTTVFIRNDNCISTDLIENNLENY